MAVIYVGVGEFAATKMPGDAVRTMALGSCVGVIFLVPDIKAVGLLGALYEDITNDTSEKFQL